jgi:predicted MFS family arabinose efflux permease
MNLFHLGSNLFTSSYTPFLRGNGLSNFEILGLDIFLAVINALAILNRFSDVSRMGDPAVPVEFFMLRGIAFLLGGLGSLYLLGRPALYLTLLLYLLMGLANTNIVIGMNKLIYDKLPAGGEGGTLGVYSSLNNFCILVGSLVSGSISLLFGFHVTFFLASLVLFISATAVEWHFHPKRVWDDDPYE